MIQYTQPAIAQNETVTQSNALYWIRNNVSHNAVVITNSYLYTDLHEASNQGATFPNAHIYWNAALDPEVRGGLLHDDWNKIDYIIVDAQMLKDMQLLVARCFCWIVRSTMPFCVSRYQTDTS